MKRSALVAALLAALLAACAGIPPATRERSALDARVAAQLESRGLGADALAVMDNVVRHDAPPPRAAQPLVRELLKDPLAAADAAALFRRLVPPGLLRLAEPHPAPAPKPFDELLGAYIEELAAARRDLLLATGKAPIDEAAILRGFASGQIAVDPLLAVAAATDGIALARANSRFLGATARFVEALQTATGMPREARRFDSPIGVVSIGSPGPDRHGPDAALIIDPGGDDVYERAPLTGGAVSVIIDLGGNDRYLGSDAVVRGLSAIVDLAGDDRYEMDGPGLGAAVAGVSVVVDRGGNDFYRATYFGEAAAAFGIGALLDLAGDDRYEILAFGQGFGLGGGLGLLWDRGGDDSYKAARYAQGNGTHEAVGVLRDEAGNDRYEVGWGAAQGMGLDLALGVLFDGSGDDTYVASAYAQGTGTANGLGLLFDGGGNDRWQTDGDPRTWGQAEWFRRLPTLGFLLHGPGRSEFALPGKVLAEPPAPRKLVEAQGKAQCPPELSSPTRAELAALRRDHLDAVYEMGGRVRCAPPWDELVRLLDADPATPLGGAIALALREQPATPAQRAAILRRLDAHPRCSVRAGALVARADAAAAQAALGSSCYLMQAAALEVLERLGVQPASSSLPSFLRK